MIASHLAHIADNLPPEWSEKVGAVLDYVEAQDTDDKVLGKGNRKDKEFLLLYHLGKGTLLIARDVEGTIAGIVTWYRLRSPWTWTQIERWRPDDADGKDIIIGHMLARDAESRRCLLNSMSKRIPDAEECRFFGFRHNKVVNYKPRHINRFFNN